EIGSSVIERYRYVKYSMLHEVAMYELHVREILDEWDEMNSRNRRVVRLDLATTMIEDSVAPVVKTFREWCMER
ncbi:MAG: hypothetical protein AAFU85_33245, partial [Planctomycetota bacterium]